MGLYRPILAKRGQKGLFQVCTLESQDPTLGDPGVNPGNTLLSGPAQVGLYMPTIPLLRPQGLGGSERV